MSAHCDDCGHDLPYDLECRWCLMVEALTYVAKDATTLTAAQTTASGALHGLRDKAAS